ncbi:MAG: helix-turn-helix transcriptional regulator [Prevotellaceae bacterium]|nr:helix-turn-helix transcriptional regulator [Candidatus Minthosoma equi]
MTNERLVIRELHGGEVNILDAEQNTIKLNKTGIFICKEGEVNIRIDNNEYHLQKNSLIVYFSFSELHIINHSNNLQGILIGADLEIIQPLLYHVTNFNALFVIKKHPHQIISDQQYVTLRNYISLLVQTERRAIDAQYTEQSTTKPIRDISKRQSELIANCLILEIIQCYAEVEYDTTPLSRRDEVLQKFVSTLYRKYRYEHEVNYYANQQFLTSRYFSAIIKEKSGKTPSQWITMTLLVDAKKMLRSNNRTIRDISDTLNFPNQSYFGKWFKNLTGVGPLDYRNGKKAKDTEDEDFADIIEKGINFVSNTH